MIPFAVQLRYLLARKHAALLLTLHFFFVVIAVQAFLTGLIHEALSRI